MGQMQALMQAFGLGGGMGGPGGASYRCGQMMGTMMALQTRLAEVMSLLNSGGYVVSRPTGIPVSFIQSSDDGLVIISLSGSDGK